MPTSACAGKETCLSIDLTANATTPSDQHTPATLENLHTSSTWPPLGYVESDAGIEFMAWNTGTDQRRAQVVSTSSTWSFPHLMSTSRFRPNTNKSQVEPNAQPDANHDGDDGSSEIQTTIEEDLCLRLSNMHLAPPPSYTDSPVYKLTEHNVFGISHPPAYTPPLRGWRSTPPFNEWRYEEEDVSEWALRQRRRLVAEKLEAESRGSYVGCPTTSTTHGAQAPRQPATLHQRQPYTSTGPLDQLLLERCLLSRRLLADSSFPTPHCPLDLDPHSQYNFSPSPLPSQLALDFLRSLTTRNPNTINTFAPYTTFAQTTTPPQKSPTSQSTSTPRHTTTTNPADPTPDDEDDDHDPTTLHRPKPKPRPYPHSRRGRQEPRSHYAADVLRKRTEVRGLGVQGTDFRERGLHWIGLDWSVLDWIGLDWTRLD